MTFALICFNFFLCIGICISILFYLRNRKMANQIKRKIIMTRMIMYKPLKLLYFIIKAVAVAFLIRVLSKYFFDFTLIESDLIFGINIAVTSGIIYFLSPFIYSFLGKNKIRTILVFMLLCFLVKSLFVIVDGSLNNIAILNIDLAGPIVNYIIIFVESIPLIANCGILSDLVHSIIEFIE